MRNVPDKSCRENQNTHCVQFFFFQNLDVYEITWKNIVEPDSLWMKIQRMRIACWIPKAINTNSGYVTHFFSTATVHAWIKFLD